MIYVAFFALWVVVTLYVLVGNYLYFAKVLPTLGESPSGLPSTQFAQVQRYIQILSETGEQLWYLPLLANAGKISIALLVGVAAVAATAWGGVAR